MKSFNNDIILRITPYLNSNELLNLALTCRRFGSKRYDTKQCSSSGGDAQNTTKSLMEEAANQILNAKEEERNWFNPKYEGETYLSLYKELEKRRDSILQFDRLFGEENGFCTGGDGTRPILFNPWWVEDCCVERNYARW